MAAWIAGVAYTNACDSYGQQIAAAMDAAKPACGEAQAVLKQPASPEVFRSRAARCSQLLTEPVYEKVRWLIENSNQMDFGSDVSI